mmetsp:Transcript_21753/g.59597  ORF Transcript_21753/g.59597 Transcript_21753/m.59597 type:complete len:232 (+) Transcript_21753:1040-1735(+)
MSNLADKLRVSELMSQKGDVSAMASTRELFAGTTKAEGRVPNYGGFVPESAAQDGGLSGGDGMASSVTLRASLHARDHLHTNTKRFELFGLKTFKEHLPRYTGFQPSEACNCRRPDFREGWKDTSYGDPNSAVADHVALAATRPPEYLKDPVTGEDRLNFGNRHETLTFFTGGTESVSDNGRSAAETFFHHSRPLEGVPRFWKPSATTTAGYIFDCYTGRHEGSAAAAMPE